ncbi:class I SAM-dependent methyltransferase [Acidobacteria bacterium AH-259-O06]|nr:class I SAM-dependent methyltransferase [Acidobacteria bacterium AH-259-O06]
MASRLRLAQDMTVLDLGCGVGGPACYLAQKTGCRIIGVSNSHSGLEEAERWVRQKKLEELVSFHFADAQELPFTDGYFDAVWSCETIHNIEDQDRLAQEFARVLKPAGQAILGDIFLLRDPGEQGPDLPALKKYGFHLLTADEWISTLQRHGSTVQESMSIGHHVGVQSLSLCTEICVAEAKTHAEGTIERVLCERTAEATSLLLQGFQHQDLSWGIWVGRKV